MKKQEFNQMKTMLEEDFIENPTRKNIWFLMGFLTGRVGEDCAEERTYTETQLSELIDLVRSREVHDDH